jgi:hypothetical protein
VRKRNFATPTSASNENGHGLIDLEHRIDACKRKEKKEEKKDKKRSSPKDNIKTHTTMMS